MRRFQDQASSPATPWHRYHPSRKIDTNADSDHELEREMDFLGIPDVHQDQFTSPGSVSPGLKGLNPWGESLENEARRGGNLASALGIDLSGEADGMPSDSSAIATGVQTSLGIGNGTVSHQSGELEAPGSLRRRHTGHDNVADSSRWTSMDNSSQYTIVPMAITHSKLPNRVETHVEPPQQPGEPGCEESQTTLSSPDLTESSLIDITSYAPSAFSVSSTSDHGYDAVSISTPVSSAPTRAHSPAFSSSSYDVLSSPPGVASMANSPHSMNASISLDTYPALDEYDSHQARHHARHPASRNPSYTASDSGWTDGDVASDASW